MERERRRAKADTQGRRRKAVGGRSGARRRHVRSGAVAAMRRALASCPDADRTEALPLSSLECSPAELLALELRVQQACQDRKSGG